MVDVSVNYMEDEFQSVNFNVALANVILTGTIRGSDLARTEFRQIEPPGADESAIGITLMRMVVSKVKGFKPILEINNHQPKLTIGYGSMLREYTLE